MTLEREFVFLVTAHLFLKFNNLILPHPRQKDFYPKNNKASCPAQSTARSSVKTKKKTTTANPNLSGDIIL